jgi:hypothetical protein
MSGREKPDGLQQFEDFVTRFGRVAGYALAGSALTPILTAMLGYAPAWPNGISLFSALAMLVSLMVLFHFFTSRRRWVFSLLLIGSAVLLVAAIVAYVTLTDRFIVYEPQVGHDLTLGCRWTEDAVTVARHLRLAADDQCPGDYRYLLEGTRTYDTALIWTEDSIRNVKLLIAASWIAIFAGLAATIGSFVIWYARPARN